MRLNRYGIKKYNDPLFPDPESAIAARADLLPESHSTPWGRKGPRNGGAIDCKIVNASMAKKMAFTAIAGPTSVASGEDQPVRTEWKRACARAREREREREWMGEWTSRKQSQPTIVCVPNDSHTHNTHTLSLSLSSFLRYIPGLGAGRTSLCFPTTDIRSGTHSRGSCWGVSKSVISKASFRFTCQEHSKVH